MSTLELVAPQTPAGAQPHHGADVHSPDGHYWAELSDVASAGVGSRVLFATDDWFSAAERMLVDSPPEFDPAAFTDWGKTMDGWESKRKRVAGHDWSVVELGLPAVIRGLELDTGFFTGNQVPAVSIQAGCLDAGAAAALAATRDQAGVAAGGGFAADAAAQLAADALDTVQWTEILPQTKLDPGYEDTRYHFFGLEEALAAPPAGGGGTHLRVNMFPDGGLSRLRVRGEVVPAIEAGAAQELDMAAIENGGVAIEASNKHYGRPANLIAQGRAAQMNEGWETARNPNRPAVLEVDNDGKLLLSDDQFDWAIIRLGCLTQITKLEVDTNHFKGNCPESCELQGAVVPLGGVPRADEAGACERLPDAEWATILPRTNLTPHFQHYFSVSDEDGGGLTPGAPAVTHVRLRIFPDGGVSRLRVCGTPVTTASKL